jgi:hypothetical protein
MSDDLDTIIDDVAKAMTAAPTDPEFARRVSMRIADAGARRPIWSRPWVLVPIASACVLVLAMVVGREKPVPLTPDATPRVGTPTIVAPAATAPAMPSGDFVERGFQPRGPERAALRTAPIAPPPAIAPIEVDRLDIQPLVEMDAIQISPIAIDRIDIAAMP